MKPISQEVEVRIRIEGVTHIKGVYKCRNTGNNLAIEYLLWHLPHQRTEKK